MKKRRAAVREIEIEEVAITFHALYTCYFRPAAEGGYLVTCPRLPQIEAWGKTLRAARQDARWEIVGYLEDLAIEGKPLPPPDYVPRASD
jgi:predicted RNase H-like HicB family nuclease